MSVAIPSCLFALDSSNPYDLQVRVVPILFFKAKNGGGGGTGCVQRGHLDLKICIGKENTGLVLQLFAHDGRGSSLASTCLLERQNVAETVIL